MLESFGESPKACVTNSSRPPEKLKGKENPDLPLVFLNYRPPIVALSLCFNHLVLSTFRQCRSAMPKRSAKPIASIHHTVQCPWRNPYVNWLRALFVFLSWRLGNTWNLKSKFKFQVVRIEKQIRLFVFWEKLRLNNFVSRLTDLYIMHILVFSMV